MGGVLRAVRLMVVRMINVLMPERSCMRLREIYGDVFVVYAGHDRGARTMVGRLDLQSSRYMS